MIVSIQGLKTYTRCSVQITLYGPGAIIGKRNCRNHAKFMVDRQPMCGSHIGRILNKHINEVIGPNRGDVTIWKYDEE